MPPTAQAARVRAGDAILVSGHAVGETARSGEILEVLGEAGHEHYRVRWEDGRESVFFPSSDTTVRPKPARRGRAR